MIDLKDLERRLDYALENETIKGLAEFLIKCRNETTPEDLDNVAKFVSEYTVAELIKQKETIELRQAFRFAEFCTDDFVRCHGGWWSRYDSQLTGQIFRTKEMWARFLIKEGKNSEE